MSSKFLATLTIFAIGSTLPACSSVSDNIPVVKIERKTPKNVKTQSASYVSPSAIGSGPNVQKAEAAIVCENENMRARARDKNSKNDSARVLILEDNDNSSSQVIGEVVVNCRQYFEDKSVGLVPASYGDNYAAPQPAYSPEPDIRYETPNYVPPQVQRAATQRRTVPSQNLDQNSGLFYAVNRGDTLYRIAVNHCTSVDAIARLNNIDDPTSIDVADVLRMPVGNCN